MKLQLPATALSPYVSHYWLSRNNRDTEHLILPDGCVDVVYGVGGVTFGLAYGVATRKSFCVMTPDFHYLGICFRPGQSRHFLKFAQNHLTDSSLSITGLAGLSPESFADEIASGEAFQRLDKALLDWVARQPIESNAVDVALATIDRCIGYVSIENVASQVGVSRRQLERYFLRDVGISPKNYARIRRWQYTFGLLRSRRSMALADIAQVAGYADQSHMSRDFRYFFGQSPGSVAVDAFVQEQVTSSYYAALERLHRHTTSQAYIGDLI